MSVYVLTEEEYGRVIATLVSDCRYRQELEWAIIGPAEKHVLEKYHFPEGYQEAKEHMIGCFVERLFLANQMAFIYSYRDEDPGLRFLPDGIENKLPYSYAELNRVLGDIRYNILSNGGHCFLSAGDAMTLKNLALSVCQRLIRERDE